MPLPPTPLQSLGEGSQSRRIWRGEGKSYLKSATPTRTLIAQHGKDSTLAIALGRDFKGKVSIVIYAIAILLATVNSWLAFGLYILVAIMWLIPDRSHH